MHCCKDYRTKSPGWLEMAETSPVGPIEAVPEGKPYEGLFTASQEARVGLRPSPKQGESADLKVVEISVIY